MHLTDMDQILFLSLLACRKADMIREKPLSKFDGCQLSEWNHIQDVERRLYERGADQIPMPACESRLDRSLKEAQELEYVFDPDQADDDLRLVPDPEQIAFLKRKEAARVAANVSKTRENLEKLKAELSGNKHFLFSRREGRSFNPQCEGALYHDSRGWSPNCVCLDERS